MLPVPSIEVKGLRYSSNLRAKISERSGVRRHTLFNYGVGRSDFLGGDYNQMARNGLTAQY